MGADKSQTRVTIKNYVQVKKLVGNTLFIKGNGNRSHLLLRLKKRGITY